MMIKLFCGFCGNIRDFLMMQDMVVFMVIIVLMMIQSLDSPFHAVVACRANRSRLMFYIQQGFLHFTEVFPGYRNSYFHQIHYQCDRVDTQDYCQDFRGFFLNIRYFLMW